MEQRREVLGETRPTKARPREQERAADSRIRTKAMADIFHVGPDPFTERGYFIHKGDPHGEH